MITVIAGPIPFLQEQALDRLKQSWGDCDVQTFFGPDTKATQIIAACQTLSLLGGSTAVLVRHAESLPKKEQDLLLKESQRFTGESQLVLLADKIDKRLKFWQHFLKHADQISAEAPAPKSLRSWFLDEIETRGRPIESDAIEQLVSLAYDDFVEAVLLLERVTLYRKPDERIRGSDMTACRVGREAAQIFAWSEAIGAQQWKKALALLQHLWAHHEEPLAILALLVRHFRILFKARENEALWGRSGELARVLAVPPFVVDKYCQQAKRYGRKQLWKIWNELLETDRQLKSSPVPRQLVLEGLVWRLRKIAA